MYTKSSHEMEEIKVRIENGLLKSKDVKKHRVKENTY